MSIASPVHVLPPKSWNSNESISGKQTISTSRELTNIGSSSVHKRIRDESIKNSILRSTGLKAISDGNWLTPKFFRDCKEPTKVLISTSRRILLSRLGVHLLPVTISLSLIALNIAEVLHGPDISALARFALQVAAKFHELTIGGSCTAIVLDVLRYYLLNDGINLGLLSSAFSVVGLNFLWSPNFLSIIRAPYNVRTRFLLFCLIVVSCVLISVVGPASALLFTPTQVWRQAAKADYYIGGSEDQLWPTYLNENHSGPARCQQDPSSSLHGCLYGGYRAMLNTFFGVPSPLFQVILSDWAVNREMRGRTYPFPADGGSAETWAYTSRCDVASLLNDMNYKYGSAQGYATGRNERLRAFNDGNYYLTEAKVPVGRTVCGPTIVIQNDTNGLLFPILAPDRAWRNKSLGPFQTQGKLAYLPLPGLQRINTTTSNQIRATWHSLNSTFGAATAGLAIVSQSDTTIVGRACTLDCRWALGQTVLRSNAALAVFEVQIGKPSKPTGNSYQRIDDYSDFFGPALTPWYSDTIKVDQQWLDAMSPRYIPTDEVNGFNISAFEALLPSEGGDPAQMMSMDAHTRHDSIVMHEYISTVFFVDALARTSWNLTLVAPDALVINPDLQQVLPGFENMLNGAPMFARPAQSAYTVCTATWHGYGTAWALQDIGQWVAVQILGFHVIVVILHCLLTCYRRRSMEALDSIVELVVLAWNSSPTRRDQELKNCAGGIFRSKTLETKIRIVATSEGSSSDRIELVVVDEKGQAKDGRLVEQIKPAKMYS